MPGEHYSIEEHVAEQTGDLNHQGVFGIFRTPVHTLNHRAALSGPGTELRFPGNVGTLLRSAAAFGFDEHYCGGVRLAPCRPKPLAPLWGRRCGCR